MSVARYSLRLLGVFFVCYCAPKCDQNDKEPMVVDCEAEPYLVFLWLAALKAQPLDRGSGAICGEAEPRTIFRLLRLFFSSVKPLLCLLLRPQKRPKGRKKRQLSIVRLTLFRLFSHGQLSRLSLTIVEHKIFNHSHSHNSSSSSSSSSSNSNSNSECAFSCHIASVLLSSYTRGSPS